MRIQIELPDSKVEELKFLMEEAGTSTYKDLFNSALTLLEWCVDQSREGRTLAAVDESGSSYRELVVPLLEAIKRDSKETVMATSPVA